MLGPLQTSPNPRFSIPPHRRRRRRRHRPVRPHPQLEEDQQAPAKDPCTPTTAGSRVRFGSSPSFFHLLLLLQSVHATVLSRRFMPPTYMAAEPGLVHRSRASLLMHARMHRGPYVDAEL